jgi:hypothetical protein
MSTASGSVAVLVGAQAPTGAIGFQQDADKIGDHPARCLPPTELPSASPLDIGVAAGGEVRS